MLSLVLDGEGPLHRQTYRALREAILSGRLRGGARLDSTRGLARDLGVSRNTVLEAYEQLVAEGYATTRAGSGTFVADALPRRATRGSESERTPRETRSSDPAQLASFGQGLFVFPHGSTVDAAGNLWITDAGGGPGKGHQVFKFSPDGRVLMTLGKPGISGSGPDLFDQPTDVVVSANGSLFVTDSHRNGRNNRVIHFTKDGKYVKEWGRKGAGPGELPPRAVLV